MTKTERLKIHSWLRSEYGNANSCSSLECDGLSKKYNWALKKGKEYEKNISNYRKLCIRCHKKYDMRWNNFNPVSDRGVNICVKRDVHLLLKVRAAKEGLTISELVSKLLKLK